MRLSVSLCVSLLCGIILLTLLAGSTGCANIIPPGGGPKDTLPPVLVAAIPPDSAINYSGNRITLTFDEYVTIENVQENVLVSPVPKNIPVIDYKLRNVTVKIRDTLEPNTTYSINFGNAIKDVNEGNVFEDFTYVFSTGPTIDDNILTGNVTLAETGKVDSTLIAVLYRNLEDSAVAKEKPRYIARVNGRGNFMFNNLPSGRFALYVVPNSFTLRYDDTTRPFAFYGQPVELDSNLQNLQLYAYTKPKAVAGKVAAAPSKDKTLRFSSNLSGNSLDFLDPLHLDFNRPIGKYDTTAISLLNEDMAPYTDVAVVPDTNQVRFVIRHTWLPNTKYNLVLQKDAFADTSGVTLARTDTLSFTTKKEEDYGSLKIRFTNIDTSRNPVLQLVQNNEVIIYEPIRQRDWYRKLVKPGAYDVKILYDLNKNNKWDTGSFFDERRQPEIVEDLGISIEVRANWDNEKEIVLK